ncbi:hypothetical protein B0H14DRAFT_2750861 [Mycena olivaceomarginata]|nr:hypothetical protein B0H14DRAFT_2750861 [Mycena olivaceomarginata]
MTETAHLSVHHILLEQTARTSRSSETEIKKLIEESASKIVWLDVQIAVSLYAQIAAFVELRERERTIISALRSLIAPIRILPVELLAEIFIFLLEDTRTPWPRSRLTHFQQAFRISHVCTHWRQIANTTPGLWTGIVAVSGSEPPKIPESVYADGMEAWLARSAPLSVPVVIAETLYMMPSESKAWPQKTSLVLEALLRISSRWCSLQIRGSTSLAFLARLAELRQDNLEEMTIGQGVDWLHDPATTVLPFGTTPRLRKASIFVNTLFEMPWAQLTDLTVRTTHNDPVDVLAKCENLVTASIGMFVGTELSQPITDIVTLKYLRTLSLKRTGSSRICRLYAPALECLYLDNISYAQIWQLTALQSGSPNITKLDISHSNLTSAALMTILSHAPSLTHLSLTRCFDDDDVINALCYKAGVAPLVPRLHSLSLVWVSEFSGDTEKSVVRMIHSRWWTDRELDLLSSHTVSRWASVALGTQEFSEPFENAMKDLRAQGLEVCLLIAERYYYDYSSDSD